MGCFCYIEGVNVNPVYGGISMDLVDIIKDLVSSVGFPIVAYLLMWKENQKLTTVIDKVSDNIADNNKRLGRIEKKLNIKQEEDADE